MEDKDPGVIRQAQSEMGLLRCYVWVDRLWNGSIGGWQNRVKVDIWDEHSYSPDGVKAANPSVSPAIVDGKEVRVSCWTSCLLQDLLYGEHDGVDAFNGCNTQIFDAATDRPIYEADVKAKVIDICDEVVRRLFEEPNLAYLALIELTQRDIRDAEAEAEKTKKKWIEKDADRMKLINLERAMWQAVNEPKSEDKSKLFRV